MAAPAAPTGLLRMSCSGNQTAAPLASAPDAAQASAVENPLCPPGQAAAIAGGKSSVEGVTPPAATEVRLVSGGRVATRLATAASPGHLPRDDGYCSSDSTPKSSGKSRAACGHTPPPLSLPEGVPQR